MALPLLAGAVVSMVPAVPTMLCQRRRTARSRSQPIFCAEGRPSLDNLKTLDTLINRGLDTVEDAGLLARRVPADYVTLSTASSHGRTQKTRGHGCWSLARVGPLTLWSRSSTRTSTVYSW